jgi:hypothetical protein
MRWVPPDAGYGEYWEANRPELKYKIRARATAALDFLERVAGRDSQWSVRAQDVFDNNHKSMETGARALGDVLREWAEQVDTGMVVPRAGEVQGVRAVASTDLMEQVRVLVADKSVHPVAPILLAGGALEIALRAAVEELELAERPSITAYARRLRSEDLLTAQDMKDVEQMAGVRNAAAHGGFEGLGRERSGEEEVDLLFQQSRGHPCPACHTRYRSRSENFRQGVPEVRLLGGATGGR